MRIGFMAARGIVSESEPRRKARTSVLAVLRKAKTLMPGQFICPEQIEKEGPPTGHGLVGSRAAITSISGFAKLYKDAGKVLTV